MYKGAKGQVERKENDRKVLGSATYVVCACVCMHIDQPSINFSMKHNLFRIYNIICTVFPVCKRHRDVKRCMLSIPILFQSFLRFTSCCSCVRFHHKQAIKRCQANQEKHTIASGAEKIISSRMAVVEKHRTDGLDG